MGRFLPPGAKQKIAIILNQKKMQSANSMAPTTPKPPQTNPHPNLAPPTPNNGMSFPKEQKPIFAQGESDLNKGKFFTMKKKLAPGKF